MVSLTTIYGTGAAIGTVAAFVAAYVGHKIYPIQTGGNNNIVFNINDLSDVKSTLTPFIGNDKADFVQNKANELYNSIKNLTAPPQQPLNTEVTPLEAPVKESSFPQVELSTVQPTAPPPSAPPIEEESEPTAPQFGGK